MVAVVKNSCGQTITQYNVQTGDAVNNLNQVAPAASGTVLTSNGVASQPSFQAISSFVPNSTVNLKDDFIGSILYNGPLFTAGELTWYGGSLWSPGSSAADSSHPGVIAVNSVTISNLFLGSTTVANAIANLWFLGGGSITINWVFKIVTASTGVNRYILRLGMGITDTAADQVNGVYFEYSDNINSGNWVYKTANASARTTTNSSTAVTTGWHNAQIVINAAASSISYTIDGVSLGAAITSNITTAGITPFLQVYVVAGGIPAGAVCVDLFYATQTLTTAR